MRDNLRINHDRLLRDLEELAQIGATDEGGVARPAFSDADLEARHWFAQRVAEDGFEYRIDGIGNVSAVLPAADPAARAVMFGSHLDTVVNGGRYDGALGVAAALEVLRTIRDSDLNLPVHLEAMSFTDEEGTWGGLMGSRALAGALNALDFEHSRGDVDALRERMQAASLTIEGAMQAQRDPETIKAWVEVHIEQGTRLEDSGLPIGIVTSIVGIASYWLTFKGRADHAGTAPMERRLDAMRGVAEFVRQSRELVMNRFERGVVNCGMVEVNPGAFNIVPAEARLAVEFRHSEEGRLEAMREALISLALHIVEVEGLSLDVEKVSMHPPAPMHREVINCIERSCHSLNLGHQHLASYAGHDSQVMAGITRAGMFFVPSVGGVSHSPRELTLEDDLVNAGNVLLHTVLNLAEG